MTSGISNTGVYTDLQSFTELKADVRKNSPEAIRETARQFEGIFMQMMLKSMRDASLGEGLFDNDQSKLYSDMFDKQVSLEMTKNKGIGLADMLVRQLSSGGQNGGQIGGEEMPLTIASQQRGLRGYGVGAPAVGDAFSPSTPQAFIQRVMPYAEKAAAQLGIDAKVLVAQAALETGWGQSTIKHADGRESFNFFGIKAGSSWSGDTINVPTHEYYFGQRVDVNEDFRSYRSIEHGFADYVNFIKGNPRYSEAVRAAQRNDNEGYVNALQAAGYATDPDYAAKIKSIVERSAFTETVAITKSSVGGRI